MQRSDDCCCCWVMIYVVNSYCCENMFLKIERQTIKKEKRTICLNKEANIIELKKSFIKYCNFFQFMYKNIKVSVTLTLTLKVSDLED